VIPGNRGNARKYNRIARRYWSKRKRVKADNAPQQTMISPYFKTIPVDQIDTSTFPSSARQPDSEGFRLALNLLMVRHVGHELLGNEEWNPADYGVLTVVVDGGAVSVSFIPRGMSPEDVASFMFRHGNMQQGIDFLEFIIREYSPGAAILYTLGLAYNQVGRFEDAALRLGKSVELEPGRADAWVALGLAQHKLGRIEQAEQMHRKALEVDPHNVLAMRNLGASLSEQRRYTEALPFMASVLATNPDDLRMCLGVAMTIAHMGDEATDVQLNQAQELVERLIAEASGTDLYVAAKQVSSALAVTRMRRNVPGSSGVRLDVVEYMTAALKRMGTMSPDVRNRVVLELAEISSKGVSINDPETKYEVKSLGSSLSGLQITAFLFAGLQQIRPGIDMGVDFSREYAIASKQA